MSSEQPAIQISNVCKRFEIYEKPHHRLLQSFYKNKKQLFREFWALRDIDITINKGETVGIIGKNGAGKSTLLQIICGTLAPTDGELTINGKIAALLELGAGFNPEFTGRENIYMYATLLGLSDLEIDFKFNDIVAFADIGDFLEQPVKTYSSGMFVRLAFAVIAHVDADILVIDEALAVGDVFFTQKCMRFLRNFQQNGTILFVSHDTSAVTNFCSRAIWLDSGTIKLSGSSKEVTEKYLEGIYEVNQDTKRSQKKKTTPATDSEETLNDPLHDQRLPFLQNSNLRNDLEIFHLEEQQQGFGTGHATILHANLEDQSGKKLSWAVGGETVKISVQVHCSKDIDNPIIGFIVKDKLGQTLFGDNTYLSYMDTPVICQANSDVTGEFTFTMPILPSGAYSITVAFAEGSQEEHVQHHWIHDAITFESHSTSLSTGLVGIPMHSISLATSA